MSEAAAAATWEDPRVLRGMARQLEERRALLDDGARAIGWKMGLGTPAALERFSSGGPVVGFLTDRTLLDSGARVEVGGWGAPAFEAECAVHIGAEVDPEGDDAAVAAAIAGLGTAIELADPERVASPLEEVVAINIFHRGVILAPPVARTDLAGVAFRITREGEEPVVVEDPAGAVGGTPVVLARHAARVLAAAGEALRAGDVLITGSVIPPVALTAPGRFTVEAGGFEPVAVEIAR